MARRDADAELILESGEKRKENRRIRPAGEGHEQPVSGLHPGVVIKSLQESGLHGIGHGALRRDGFRY
jgi:hypothetical protein